ncbi:MAG: dihydrodipicolinate synthase family protein [Opitutales bacterium]
MTTQPFSELVPEGVIGFPVTPFHGDYSLHLEGFCSNLEMMLEEPFSTFVAAGGTGEMYSLGRDEYISVVNAAVEVAADRLPVVAGVGYGSRIAVNMATEAAKAGVSALLVLPPYYPNASFEGLLAYCKTIGNATNLPLIIYTRDWVKLTPVQAEQLAEEVPTLAAWKDGQGDLRNYQRICARLGDRFTWIGGVGDDLVGGYYGIGIRRYTSSISAVAPKLSILLHEAGVARDESSLTKLTNQHVLPLYNLRTRRKGYEVSAMKALLDLRDMCGGPVRPPLVDLMPEEKEELKTILDGWAEAKFL